MSLKAKIKAYNRLRDEMLLACDVDLLIAFMKEHNPGHVFSCREVAEMTLHKSRTAVRSLPMEARRLSKRWLLDRGFTSMDDGDV